MRFLLPLFLFLLRAVAAQNNTWGGTSTSLFPNLAPNAVVISTAGTNGLTVINGNVASAKVKFAAPMGTPSTNDNLMIRSNDGFVHISTYTVGDLLSLGGGGNNLANTDLTATGNRLSDWNTFSLGIFNLNGLSFTGDGGQLFEDSGGVILRSGAPQVEVTPSKVELKAIGSNSINLHSDAINTSTATVGQVWTLQNATTGKGEWADGSSPSGGNVTTVDTISELSSESTSVVITQGYYVVGDGGHAAYRYVSGDLTATNTVTVFEGVGGRYFLMQSGSISAKQAGAVGDGVSDDGPFLQALLDACENITARIEPLNYLSTTGLILPDHTKVIARGAVITVETTGEDRAVDMGSWCEWVGGTVIDAFQSGGDGSSNDHCPFRFGDWFGVVNAGVSNSILREVTIGVSGDYPAVGIFVTQDSHNIRLDTLTFSDSSTMDDAIVFHWGFVDPGADPSLGTRHPNNCVVRNIAIGALTTTTRDGGGLSVSAGYDIDVSNVTIQQARYAAYLTAGDHGFKWSGFTQQLIGSVWINNVTCFKAVNSGMFILGLDSESVQHELHHVVNNCTLIGANAGSGQAGVFLNNTRNITFRNTVIAGHEYGTTFTNGCQNVVFDNCTFATNRLSGFHASDPNTKNVTVQNCWIQNNSRGVSGTNAAGIRLLAGENFRIINNNIGNPITEPNQEVGIECIPGFVNATISDNRVLNVKGGGVSIGYYLGNAADSGHLWVVNGNSANATTLMAVPQALPYAVRDKYRDFSAASAPTVGAFIKGDAIYFTEATATPFALKVTVSGSPGTTVTMF